MDISLVQQAKLALLAFSGLDRDALHIYGGMGVFLLVLALGPRARGSWRPLLAVLGVALVVELLDLRDDLASLGYWRWQANLHDLLNTACCPAVLSLLMGRTSLFECHRS